MYERNECAQHALWSKHLSIAYWLSLLGGIAFALSTENIANLIPFVVMSALLYIVHAFIDVLHARWHVQQDKEE